MTTKMHPSSETQELNPKSIHNPLEESVPPSSITNQENDITSTILVKDRKLNPFSIFLEPIEWLQMLSSRLHPSFILGVFVVYGLSQGFAASFFKVVSDFYWKDVQKVQPSQVQIFIGLYYIPWVMKPIWGLLTDVFPIKGYKRRPYFIFAGILGVASALVVALSGKIEVALALLFLIGITAAMAIADVTIDACIARKSIEIKSLAPDMQSLCGFCSSAGALFGYSTSGFFVHHLGAQGSLGLLAIPPAAIIVLGFVMYELTTSEDAHYDQKSKAMDNLREAVEGMYRTIQTPQVWKPSLYMFLSLSLSISTHEGQFFWYTDPKAGPAFSQEFIGMIYAIGAMASMVGVLVYHKMLKECPFRRLVFWAQLLYATSGMLDVLFVLRWNLALGIPDYFFIITEECISRIVSRIRWMPMMVLSSRLCPLGIEGTFFALLMCIDSIGSLTSKSGGGMVLHLLHVTRTDFKNLWLTLLIRNLLRFATLSLVFLVPNVSHSDLPVIDDTFTKSRSTCGYEENIQLVTLSEKMDA